MLMIEGLVVLFLLVMIIFLSEPIIVVQLCQARYNVLDTHSTNN